MLGVWAVSGWDALLLVIATQVLQMLRQLAPLVRFDGYHILADLTGVPDLYSHIKPTLLGLLPTHWRKPETNVLKPWARIVVTTWVLVVVPLLALSFLMMVLVLPRFLATAWDNLGKQASVLNDNLAAGDFFGVGARALSILAICVPVAGVAYILTRMVRRTTKKVWKGTEGHPTRRGLAGVLAAAVVLALAFAWWPGGQYRPIQPDERGALMDGLSLAVSTTGLGSPQAPVLREGQVGSAAESVVATPTALGTKDQPKLALILLPHGGVGEPAWVFPFNKPDAPDDDGNQAMAVNTKDGSSLYDVAFALVELDKFAQAIKAIVEQESGAPASGSDSDVSGDPGSGSDPGSTAGPGGEGTTGPSSGTDPSSDPTTGQTTEPASPTSTEPTCDATAGAVAESTTTP